MKLAKALSRRIRALREAAGLSQEEVATKGDLSLSQVAKLEQAKKSDPRTSTVLALAAALGVRPGQLLDDLFPAEPPPQPRPAPEPAPADLLPGETGNGRMPAEDKPKKGKKKKGKKKK